MGGTLGIALLGSGFSLVASLPSVFCWWVCRAHLPALAEERNPGACGPFRSGQPPASQPATADDGLILAPARDGRVDAPVSTPAPAPPPVAAKTPAEAADDAVQDGDDPAFSDEEALKRVSSFLETVKPILQNLMETGEGGNGGEQKETVSVNDGEERDTPSMIGV